MANYYIVSKGLEADSIQYLTKVLSSLLDSAEWEHSNLSAESTEEEIASLKACIKKTNPKVLISLGADASKILSEKFRFITSARGKLQDYTDGDYSIKMVITYSPKFLLTSDVNMDRYGSTFLQDLEYAIKYVNGQLIDISQKNLQYAKTFKEFEDYFNQYLKDAQLPAYDIETNGKDPRSDAFRIVGYSLAPNGSTGIYVIRETLEYKMPEEDWQKCVELTKDYISSRTVLVHNIMYERPATLNEWGINITNFEDSLIKARLLLGGRTGAGLKEQCARNLGYPDWDTDLHTFLGSMETMRIKLRPTAKGKDRNDYILLKEKGFSALLDDYTTRLEKQETLSKEFETAETEEQAKEIRLKIDKIKMDSRQLAVKEAMETLTEVISQYYDDPNPVLELAGRQVITLIDIQHDGIIPYSSVPINIITKYGALDSVGTQDLNDYLSAQMTNESTEEVNLWNGYRILKANFIVGSEMELQGLYWNDRIASDLKVWLTEKAYDAMVNMIRSGLIDENIIENCKPVLLQIIKEELNTTVKDILGDFDLLKSGIKLKSTGKRITWLQLIDKLGKPFLDSHRDKILRYVKENITNRELYPNYTDMLDFFNPSSTSIVPTLKRIFLNDELQRANGVREVIAQYNTGLDLETIPDPDRTLYQSYMNIAVYNKKIDDEELEGTKISNNQIYKILAEGLSTIIPKTKELQAIQRKAATYTFEDTSESTILSIYENLTMIGCDIEDESTWTDEFRFLVNFRTFKKSLKLINVYIEGDKIGRGSVWVVNKADLEDSKSRFTIRKRKYSSEISENETYLMQSSWGVCFTGDTKVKCLDGNSYSFEELVSKKTETLWVYACTNSGRIVPALATNIRKTQKKARLVEVELDSGEKIRCTPAHLFMLRDGSYKKAVELSPADSLMPLYLKHDQDGYILCMDNEVGKFQKVHILINKAMNPKGYSEVLKRCSLPENFAVTHHKDYNKENNEPSNLEWMSNIEHSKYHYEVNDAGLRGFNKSERPESWKEINRQHLDLYNKSEKHKEVSKRSLATWKANNPEKNAENGRRNLANYRKNHYEEYIAGLKSRSSRPEHIALFKENGRIYRKSEAFLAHCRYMADTFLNTPENLVKASKRMTAFNSDPVSVRNQVRGKIGKLIKFLIDSGLEFNKETFDKHKVRGCVGYDNILKYFDSYEEAYSFGENYNHKVTAVRLLETTEDVYDLEVPEYHNFALDCGIFVHNCTAQTLRWRGGIHTLPAGPMVKGIYTSRYKGGVIAAPDYCLTGDTEVLLLDNTKKCLSELEGIEEFFVYSYDEKTKKVVVGRGHDCRIVRTVDETIKLTFDDNSSIECSVDHTFMKLSEQKFVKAEDLSVGDTIQTLQLGRCEGNFRRTKDNKVLVVGKGRLEVENLDGSKILVQALANDWNLANSIYSSCDKPMHIHHTDGNPDNNDPRNLAYITGSQHNRNHAKEQWSNTERLYNGQTFREKMTEVATKVFAPLRLGINKNPVNIEKRRQGNLKVHEARFAQGLEVMLQHYSAEELVIRFNHGAEYDSELRTLLGVTRLPKGMGYRTLNSLKTTFIDYLENLIDNPITKKNLAVIREIRAKLPANGVSGQDLFKAIIDHNLSLERFEDSRQYLVQNNLLPSNNHVTLKYVEKAFGSIENFYLWHTYFADTYITGYRSQNPLKVVLSSNTEGQVTEAKVYDHKSAYSRLSYRVYFTDNEFLEVAPGQRIRTASGVYKYPEELGGYSVMSHYLKETENNTVKVAKYDPSLSRAVVKIEKVFYPASVEFEHFSIDKDHNYLVPVYTDEGANNLNVVLHNDSQHRYITKIEQLKYDTPKELYCFTVDQYHNFFTGQGVLTHQSQQEIRTISGLSNCQSLLEAYRNGEDVHMKTAMSVFKKPADQITKNERRFCKSATFAILYGSTVGGLANLMSVPMEQAQQMMDGFFGAYPELKVWMDGKHREVERYGKVSCPKVGYFLNIDLNGFGGLEEAYKQAGNYPIQGQSSLIAGYVLNSITQYLLDNDMKTKPISFIHDSLEFDIHPRELFISCQKITSMMNDIPNNEFGIPSKAELTIGMSMGDENEVTYLEETENGGIIELQGYENDLDAILENWREVYSSVEYTDDLDSAEEIYVPRKEIFMPKLTISKYSGTRRKLLKRRFTITF